MLALTRFEKMLNIFPDKNMHCKACEFEYKIHRGSRHHSIKHWNGPYCPRCGKRLGK